MFKDEKIFRHVAKNGNIRHVEATFDMFLRHVASTCCWCGRGLTNSFSETLENVATSHIFKKLDSSDYIFVVVCNHFDVIGP